MKPDVLVGFAPPSNGIYSIQWNLVIALQQVVPKLSEKGHVRSPIGPLQIKMTLLA